jgi:hypothetical protein
MNRHEHNDFDRRMNEGFGMFNWFFKGFFILWIVSAILGVALTGVTIYAIIMLVQHFCK